MDYQQENSGNSHLVSTIDTSADKGRNNKVILKAIELNKPTKVEQQLHLLEKRNLKIKIRFKHENKSKALKRIPKTLKELKMSIAGLINSKTSNAKKLLSSAQKAQVKKWAQELTIKWKKDNQEYPIQTEDDYFEMIKKSRINLEERQGDDDINALERSNTTVFNTNGSLLSNAPFYEKISLNVYKNQNQELLPKQVEFKEEPEEIHQVLSRSMNQQVKSVLLNPTARLRGSYLQRSDGRNSNSNSNYAAKVRSDGSAHGPSQKYNADPSPSRGSGYQGKPPIGTNSVMHKRSSEDKKRQKKQFNRIENNYLRPQNKRKKSDKAEVVGGFQVKKEVVSPSSRNPYRSSQQEKDSSKTSEGLPQQAELLKKYFSFMSKAIPAPNLSSFQAFDEGRMPCRKCYGKSKKEKRECKNCEGRGSRPLDEKMEIIMDLFDYKFRKYVMKPLQVFFGELGEDGDENLGSKNGDSTSSSDSADSGKINFEEIEIRVKLKKI